ncbi:hypothetical protein LCM19_13355 [Qipengyuania flava]|nr:hypothetical protein [Qipengyuania flava]
MRKTSLILALAICGTSAHAQQRDVGGFSASAIVPERCDIASDALSIDTDSGEVRGTLTEFCNSSRGYHILANHRSLAADEKVEIEFDGQSVVLDASGQSPIAFRSGPRMSRKPIAVRSENLDSGMAISLSLAQF